MSAKEDAAFKEYVEGLKTKIPAELHTHLDALAAHEEFKGWNAKGWIGQKEIGTRFNELDAAKRQLEADQLAQTNWFNAEKPKNEKLFAEKERLSAQVQQMQHALVEAGLLEPGTTPPPNVGGAVKSEVEDLKKQLGELAGAYQQLNAALPSFLTDAMNVQHQLIKGNYEISPAEIFNYSMQNRVKPEAAFQALKASEDEKRREADVEKRIATAKEEARKEALAQRPTGDWSGRPAANATIDHLMKEQGSNDSRTRVQGASQMFREMMAKGEIPVG